MKVVVIGPNLWKQDKGQFHVHAVGCADINRDPHRYGYRQAAPHMVIEANSPDAVGDEIYADHIGEGSMNPGEGTSDCHFAPCVKFDAPKPPPTTARERALKRAAEASAMAPDAGVIKRVRRRGRVVKVSAQRKSLLAREQPLPVHLLKPGDVTFAAHGAKRKTIVVVGTSEPHGHYLYYTTFSDRSRTQLSQSVRIYYVGDGELFDIDAHTDLALPEPPEVPLVKRGERSSLTASTGDTRRQTRTKEGHMATVVKRSTKKGASTKSKPAKSTGSKSTTKAASTASSNGKARRSAADIAKLVPALVKARKAGTSFQALKKEHGFSDDGPMRAAMYREGYDAKGDKHGESAESIDASKAAGKKQVIKLRSEGAAWYRLAYLTGLTEGEVKKIVKDGGGSESRVYVKSDKPAKSSKSSDETSQASARKSSGKKVTRRASKADPSK